MTAVYLATEDVLSETVADRLVVDANHGLNVAVRLRRNGNGYLRSKLPELVRLAPNAPVFLLTDLDRVNCPPTLITSWRGTRALPQDMLFRVAVREVEAWVLADRDAFAEFSGVPNHRLPMSPECLDDPKQALLNLVWRHGRREIKRELLPARRSRAKIGLGYNQTLSEFVRESWSPARAAENADSLARTCRRLRELGIRNE